MPSGFDNQSQDGDLSTAFPSRVRRWSVLVGVLVTLSTISAGCDRSNAGPLHGKELVGLWEGSFRILTDSVHLVLEFSTTDSGTVAGRVSFPAQSIFDVPVATEQAGTEVRVDVRSLRGRYEGRLSRDRESIRGDWFQAGGKFRVTLAPTTTVPRPRRPQEPRPPFPYQVDTIRIPHSNGAVTLAGTLTLPHGQGPFPAVVLVSGSGPQDRDETLFGHRPFLVLADHLTRSGIAVLRYDDRGVAGSTGDFGSATSEDFATDALAAVAWLVNHEAIDPANVGIIGHSEGGIVAPIAATRSDRVAFIVSLAGTGIPGRDLLELQTRRILEVSGVPAPVIALNRRLQRELLDNLLQAGSAEGARDLAMKEFDASWGGLPRAVIDALGLAAQVDRALEEQLKKVASPWMFFFLGFDPSTAFERVGVPVLALNGSLDLQVPPDPNLDRIREALERGGNPHATTLELDGLNHFFQTAATGLPSEYGRIEETIAPEVLEIVADWILAVSSRLTSERSHP